MCNLGRFFHRRMTLYNGVHIIFVHEGALLGGGGGGGGHCWGGRGRHCTSSSMLFAAEKTPASKHDIYGG